jgi:chromosome segregation ATPase
MTDTAELIALMRQTFQVTGDKYFGLAADRLAAQAQEIATAHKMMDQDKQDYDDLKERFDAQAQEIERWTLSARNNAKFYDQAKERAEAAEARVRELDGLIDEATAMITKIQRERDAIEAATMRMKSDKAELVISREDWRDRAEAAEARVKRLEVEIAIHCEQRTKLFNVASAAEARIRELEDTTMSVECLDAVRRDVEAATIERCAKEAERFNVGTSRQYERTMAIAAAIRTLAKEPIEASK